MNSTVLWTVLSPAQALDIAAGVLQGLRGDSFDVLGIRKPVSPTAAVILAKSLPKLSHCPATWLKSCRRLT
jgi:hypothetical protein